MTLYHDGGLAFRTFGIPPAQGKSLVADLERQLGQPMVELYRLYPPHLKDDPLRLVYSADNSHPSVVGVQAMANALEQFLLDDSHTQRLFTAAADAGHGEGRGEGFARDGKSPRPTQAR
jgi:hypothetical protein